MTSTHLFDAQDLNTCISCGFCLPACPTYRLTGDETSSPRGRIALMRAAEHGTIDIFDPVLYEQGSFCLGCRACEPACPAGVPYGRLLEQLRNVQWKGRRQPLRIRPLLTFARRSWLIRLTGRLRRHAPATVDAVADRTLMLGCFERVLYPAVSRAAAGTLTNIRVDADQGCCGALHAHNGDLERGELLARQLADRPGRIVTTAGGCAAHLATVAGRDRVLDYSQAVLEQNTLPDPLVVNGRPARIGLQDSCHLRNGLGISAPPREVIRRLGDYVEIPGADDCCGAAGTYAILRRRDSQRVLEAKLTALADLDLDYLVVVNPGCQRQLISAVRRTRLRVKVVHLAELVALAQERS